MPDLSEDEKRQLIENDFQVQQLTQHPGWTVLLDFVVNAGGLRAWQTAVLNGGAKTTDAYQHMVGKIQGCEFVINAPARIARMADEARGATETEQ